MDMTTREVDLAVEREHERRLARYEAEMEAREVHEDVPLPDPVCAGCGEPRASVDAASGLCERCLWGPPPLAA